MVTNDELTAAKLSAQENRADYTANLAPSY